MPAPGRWSAVRRPPGRQAGGGHWGQAGPRPRDEDLHARHSTSQRPLARAECRHRFVRSCSRRRSCTRSWRCRPRQPRRRRTCQARGLDPLHDGRVRRRVSEGEPVSAHDCCPRSRHHSGCRPLRPGRLACSTAARARARLGRDSIGRSREGPGALQLLYAGLGTLRAGAHRRGTEGTNPDDGADQHCGHHGHPARPLLAAPSDGLVEGGDRVIHGLAQPFCCESSALVDLGEVSHAFHSPSARSSPARRLAHQWVTGLPTARTSPDEVSRLFRRRCRALKRDALTDPSLQPSVAAISMTDMSDT